MSCPRTLGDDSGESLINQDEVDGVDGVDGVDEEDGDVIIISPD